MAFAAAAAVHQPVVAHGADALEDGRHVACDTDRGKDTLGDSPVADLVAEVTGHLDAPSLGVLHARRPLFEEDAMVDLCKEVRNRGRTCGEEGVAHAGIRLATEILPPPVRRAR